MLGLESSSEVSTVPFLDFQCLESMSALVGLVAEQSGFSPFVRRGVLPQSGRVSMLRNDQQWLCQKYIVTGPRRTENDETFGFRPQIACEASKKM